MEIYLLEHRGTINNITSYFVLWIELMGLSKLAAAVDSVACSHDRRLISRCGNMIVYTALQGWYYVKWNIKAVSDSLNFKTHS